MKILLVSDEESSYIWDYFDPERFKGVELIISCGDLDATYLSFLATMIPAEVLYVHGNHDKKYLKKPPEGCTSIDDKIFVYKGIRFFGLGGSRSLHIREGEFQYTERQMRSRIRKRKWDLMKHKGFDVLVTHSPAHGLGDMPGTFHEGFQVFRNLLDNYQPRYHFFGHVHKRYCSKKEEIIQYGRTTLINACGYKIIEYQD
ncbi:MAG: metallophosphoesterase family protein [Eubacteriales bacterium]|jgi:Icc-related predicted phosphoesterase